MTARSLRSTDRELHQGQPVPVRGHHLDRILADLPQSPVQLEPRLLARDGEEDLADQALHGGNVDLGRQRPVHLGERREAVGFQPPDLEPTPARLDLELVAVLPGQTDLVRAEGPDDLRELLRLHGDGSAGLHVRPTLGRERDVEIRGREVQPFLPRVQEEVRQDGDRRATFHHSLQQGQLTNQLVSVQSNFHRPSSVRNGRGVYPRSLQT